MRNLTHSPSSVVVGLDGSRSALDAALWAVDEAVSRDIPLCLVYAIDPDQSCASEPKDAAAEFAAAETAVRDAVTAVESTEKPVKIEMEILRARPARALIDASASAAMLCLGDTGSGQRAQGRIGSTAAEVTASANCPVAVVRGHDARPRRGNWVVAEIEGSPFGNRILQHASEEARLREAPLRVLTSWQTRFTDVYNNRPVAEGNRSAKAQLDRQLAKWKKRYPDLDVEPIVVHGNTLNYLTEHADSVQLLVVGRERPRGIMDLVGPPGYASLHEAGCSVLVCQLHAVL